MRQAIVKSTKTKLEGEWLFPESDLSTLSFIAFDVETTGLSPVADRLVELSGVRFTLAGSDFETFSTLINPGISIPANVSRVHGITDDMVAGAPGAVESIEKFFDWASIKNSIFIAHNASFDVEFLKVALARATMPAPSNPVIDTLALARNLLDSHNYKLRTLVEFLGLPDGGYHRALADSVHVKEIFRTIVLRAKIERWDMLSSMCSCSGFDQHSEKNDTVISIAPRIKSLIETIELAIEKKQTIKVVYNNTYKSRRVLEPISLIYSRGNHYLMAYCPRAQEERTFRVDRIVSLELADLLTK